MLAAIVLSLAFPAVLGTSSLPPSPISVPTGFLGQFNVHQNVPIYAGIVAFFVFEVIYLSIKRTNMSQGASPIAIAFALIVFAVLFTNPSFLSGIVSFFFFFGLAVIILALLAFTFKRKIGLPRYLGIILLMILIYVALINSPSINSYVSSLFGVDFIKILGLTIDIASIIVLLYAAARGLSSTSPALKAVIIFLAIIIITSIFTPLGSLILTPIGIVVTVILAIIIALYARNLSGGKDKGMVIRYAKEK